MENDSSIYDVAVIGAGVVGAAIARELSRYDLSTVLLEAAPDVGMGTSKANTGIWHTGFDAAPGSLEARLLRRSYALLQEYVAEAGIPAERLGALLIARTEEQQQALPALQARALQNGVDDVYLVSAAEVARREPHLNDGALGALFVPGESIICTFTLPLALATQAVANGVVLKLNFPVRQIIAMPDGVYEIQGPGGRVACRYIVNAAGLYSDEVDGMLGQRRFTVTPRRGELIVYDKLARRLVNHILLPVPTQVTKGVLISPTVYGNVLLGPTAEDLTDKSATDTTTAGLRSLLRSGEAVMRSLLAEEITATYAGLRAATEFKDYQIHANPNQRYVCVGGIRSTGLSACLGIAEYVLELLAETRLRLIPKAEFKSIRMASIGEAAQRPYQSAQMIEANPAYGQIVCYCERVTAGELVDACHAPIPARTLDGMRRRTRALQGRCQGFNCHTAVTALLAQESGQPMGALLALEEENAA